MKETLEQPMIADQEEEKIEKQPTEENLNKKLETKQEESPDQMLLNAAFDKLYDFEPTSEEEKFNKAGIQESLEDIKLLFEDDGEEGDEDQTPSSTLIALRGLEEIQKNYPISSDVGLEELKSHCAEQIQETEGFGIEEIEDLDAVLEQSQGDVEAGISKLAGRDELSEEELLSQQEKLQKYSEIKKDIDGKKAQLLKNSSGFYGGYAQKIKTTFERAGQKLDTKMMNSKLLKMIGEKKLTTRFSKVAAAGVIVMAGGMMMLNPAEAAEIESDELNEKPVIEPESISEADENVEEIKEALTKLEGSQEIMKAYINDLGIFSQIRLINEIKENAEEIKALVIEGNDTIRDSASKNLGKVLDMYSGPLNEVKELNPEIFKQEAQKICELIDTIKTSSLRELKSKFV